MRFVGILVDKTGEYEVAYFDAFEKALIWSMAMSTAWTVKIRSIEE